MGFVGGAGIDCQLAACVVYQLNVYSFIVKSKVALVSQDAGTTDCDSATKGKCGLIGQQSKIGRQVNRMGSCQINQTGFSTTKGSAGS